MKFGRPQAETVVSGVEEMVKRSKYKVNHFVSDMLLEPWKASHAQQNGIWVYDFRRNRIFHDSPRRVFARKRVFSPAIEERYNQLIEIPMSRFLGSLKVDNELEHSDWRIQRALFLIFIAQGPRAEQALSADGAQRLGDLLSKPDNLLDSLVLAAMQHSQLIRMRVSSHQPLFYPLMGFFAVAYQDPSCFTGWSYGWAIPLTPERTLLMASKEVDRTALRETPLWAASCGLPPYSLQVAIPPGLIERCPHERIIAHIQEGRALNEEQRRLVNETRELAGQIAEKRGFGLKKVAGSFHGRFKPDFD